MPKGMTKTVLTRLAAVLTVVGLMVAGLLTAPAGAAETVTSTTVIKNTPDDGTPPWARDTLNRRTTITESGENTYKVVVTDQGTFKTARKQDAAKTPGDAGQTIKRRVTGDLNGTMTFTVTGKLKGKRGLAALQARDGFGYNHRRFAAKADVPASRQSGKWALRYFRKGATIGDFTWNWSYKTGCEQMTQSAEGGVTGNITGKKCPPPFVASVLQVKAKCRMSKTDKRQVWTVTNVAGNRDRKFWAWIGSPNPHPGQKYHEGNSWGFLHLFDPKTKHGYFTVKPGETETIVTGWGGGLAVHWWSGDAKPMRAWVYSDHRVLCKRT